MPRPTIVDPRFPVRLKTLRKQRGLSLAGLAKLAYVGISTISELEHGKKTPLVATAQALDRALGAGGELAGLVAEDTNPLTRRGSPGEAGGAGAERTNPAGGTIAFDVMRRRTLVGWAAAVPYAALEAVRHELVRSLGGAEVCADRDPDDWGEVAWQYGQAYLTSPPASLIVDLLADLTDVENHLDSARSDHRRDLSRVVAQLAALTAMSLVNLGHPLAARRWWRTARHAADVSGDMFLRVWVRGEEGIRALYTNRSPRAAVDLADQALAIGGDRYAGQPLAGKAQALALMGRVDQAQALVRTIESVLERMPSSVVDDQRTVYGWPESCLRHAESFVHSHVGDTAAAGVARQRALVLYRASERRLLALVDLHEALCLVSDGFIDDGGECASRAITSLDLSQRTAMVFHLGQRVVETVPHRDRKRPAIAHLHELMRSSRVAHAY